MVLPFVFGQRQQQAHPGTIEKAHPGRLEQELHPERIAVERDGTRQIVDADIDLADLGQARGNDWGHQVSSLGGRAAVDLARPSTAGRLTAAWIRRTTRAPLGCSGGRGAAGGATGPAVCGRGRPSWDRGRRGRPRRATYASRLPSRVVILRRAISWIRDGRAVGLQLNKGSHVAARAAVPGSPSGNRTVTTSPWTHNASPT